MVPFCVPRYPTLYPPRWGESSSPDRPAAQARSWPTLQPKAATKPASKTEGKLSPVGEEDPRPAALAQLDHRGPAGSGRDTDAGWHQADEVTVQPPARGQRFGRGRAPGAACRACGSHPCAATGPRSLRVLAPRSAGRHWLRFPPPARHPTSSRTTASASLGPATGSAVARGRLRGRRAPGAGPGARWACTLKPQPSARGTRVGGHSSAAEIVLGSSLARQPP
jgi:hypothetical protein